MPRAFRLLTRCWSWRLTLCRVLAGSVALGLAVDGGAASVRPDHSAAISFGLELQKDYLGRKTEAVVDRVGMDEMMRRVFGTGADDSPQYAALKPQSENQIRTNLKAQLAAYDAYPTLILARVSQIEGFRVLEIALTRADGTFQLAMVPLIETASGTIRIADIQFASSALEYTRHLRHSILLRGIALPGLLDPEEVHLGLIARMHASAITTAMQRVNGGDLNKAALAWSGLPAEVKGTRIWREMRNRLAFQGSAAALRDLKAEVAGGGGSPFLRFALGLGDKTLPPPAAVIDDLLLAHRQLPWLRVIKADVLLRAGRADEAFALAEDLCALTPAMPAAYLSAVYAGLRVGQSERVLPYLDGWRKLSPLAEIERLLALNTGQEMVAFRESAAFLAWKENASRGATH